MVKLQPVVSLIVSSTLLLLGGARQALAQGGPLRAGVAKVDITPPPSMFPIDEGMQVLAGVHDHLYARALVLDNGSTRVAVISVDTAGIQNAAEVVQAVSAELHVPASHLSIDATHDHNTPTFAGPGSGKFNLAGYLALMKNGIVQAAREASTHMQPARVGYGTGNAYINTNRDQKIGTSYKMGYAPERPSDKTVGVLLLSDATGHPLAVVMNYAIHGVVMFNSKTRDGKSEVTGDIGGAAAEYVEHALPGVTALWTSGAAGDQNPLFMSVYNQDSPDVHDEGVAGWSILDVQARRVGEEVLRVAARIGDTSGRATLWGASETVTCPGRKLEQTAPPPATVAGSYTPAPGNGRMVDADPVAIPISLIMVNDIALANVGGEVFNEIALRLKRESLFSRTVMLTLSNGSIGYIPSESAYLLPSAMAARNHIKPGCAEYRVVDGFLDLERQYLREQNANQ